MIKAFNCARRIFGFKTNAERFQDGINYVNETINNAGLSTKEELEPLAAILWKECYPSFEGGHAFDRGMQLRLSEMGFDNPAVPAWDKSVLVPVSKVEAFIAGEWCVVDDQITVPAGTPIRRRSLPKAHPIREVVEDSFRTVREQEQAQTEWKGRGMSRCLLTEQLTQCEELQQTMFTGNFHAASTAATSLDPTLELIRLMKRPTPRPKRLEDFFKQLNTVKTTKDTHE